MQPAEIIGIGFCTSSTSDSDSNADLSHDHN